jgi:D-alanyl-lipoteichoic acid acyltransferase DltB (MBOAT superfamily)
VLREKQAGKLPVFTLPEFAAYALFFPAYTAGPIDRAPRFITELRQRFSSPAGFQAEARPLAVADTLMGGERILWGVFKKFVLADSLAIFALNAQNASQVQSAAWAWVMLLGYTLRIYLDFSGYTDTAIGLGQIIGLKLPENFARPYLQPNLTAFWNSWHMTLAQWFRAYYFNPLTRWLRTRPAKLSIGLVVFITQLSTMMLIGLWHGVTINFLMWGAWHGLGLFIHNRYLEWLRPYQDALEARPRLAQAMRLTGWAATFVFVMLGWVWFALPGFGQAITFFGKLI